VKRLITIFFLLLFLFNAGGYYVFFWIYRQQAERDLLTRIENETYDQAEITLTIPLALPYPVSENGLTPMKGEFEYQGEHYKLIKQKLEGDVLYVVCLKNVEREKIDGMMADYSKASNDVPTQSKQTSSFLSKIFKDYQPTSNLVLTGTAFAAVQSFFHERNADVIHHAYPVIVPPPKKIS
jgi:hypothetical protein